LKKVLLLLVCSCMFLGCADFAEVLGVRPHASRPSGIGSNNSPAVGRDHRIDYRTKGLPDIDSEVASSKKNELIWPVNGGIVTSRFGNRRGRHHDGIDISAKRGTPIKAASSGKVVYAGRLSGYGNLIILKHRKNLFTAYAHADSNKVSKGDKVRQGAIIATVGRTGRASGPHLHFEVRDKTKARNPLFFLPKTATYAGGAIR